MTTPLPLVPLQKSVAIGALEEDLRALFIQMYADTMQEQADEINVYGNPHLGPFSLIERSIAADGLTVFRRDEVNLRHLHKAWKYRNPERGLHFLRTYCRAIWGKHYSVDQLWQHKDLPYPTQLRSRPEFESESDYFLTSRIRVQLDEVDFVPKDIVAALRTAIAARFVLQFRIAKFTQSEVGLASAMRAVNVVRLTGETLIPAGIDMRVGMAHVFGAQVVAYTTFE